MSQMKNLLTIYHITYSLTEKLAYRLHDSEFIIRTDHKPLKYIMDPPVQNKKIQHWTTNIHGYDCKIECIEGKKNVCADMFSHPPYRQSDSNNDNELSGPDIRDKTYEISMINSSNINHKTLLNMTHQMTDNQCTKEELNLPRYDLVTEQSIKKYLK